MLKLLFIDDEPENVQPVINLAERGVGILCKTTNFSEASTDISEWHPDIIILDLLAGGADSEPEGLNTRDFIWQDRFCPIVIYSARPDIYDDEHPPHPFIKSIQKGKGSPEKVLQVVDDFRPQVSALKDAEDEVRQSFSIAMREVAPFAFEAFSDPKQITETITRSGRRRLAALMDEHTNQGATLTSWEKYVFPPVTSDLLLGDILHEKSKTRLAPESYYVVLSPSCDLVSSGGRKPKVPSVLAARCTSLSQAFDQTDLRGTKPKKLRDKLPKLVLSQGYYQSLVPMPELKGLIPAMAANVRDLVLIPISETGLSAEDYERVASIDSPFRELISWAYLQSACRPGLPERDFEAWAEEIIQKLDETTGEG